MVKGTVGGMVYAMGGMDDRENVLASVEVFDPFTATWAYCE
jgi:hypothetical protein